jgi:hypothetical protein
MEIKIVGFKALTEQQQENASDNGCGQENAGYLIVTDTGGEIVVFESDAMEPEDASFSRDLNWIINALQKVYELGKRDALTLHKKGGIAVAQKDAP